MLNTRIQNIQTFASACNFEQLSNEVTRLIGEHSKGAAKIDAADRKALFKALRGARRFEDLMAIAQHLMNSGCDDPRSDDFDPSARRHYAQALIDSGNPTAAIDVLHLGLHFIETSTKAVELAGERHEMTGLIGRVFKQRYIDHLRASGRGGAPRPSLHQSINYYALAATGRNRADAHWPLVNRMALVALDERHHPDEKLTPQAPGIAAALLYDLRNATADQKADPWFVASLAECHIALGQWDEAAQELNAYVSSRQVDSFSIYGTLRQLTEVWGLDSHTPPGGKLVALLQAALARRSNGQITFNGGIKEARQALQSNDLMQVEAVLGLEGPIALKWLRQGLPKAEAVGRLVDISPPKKPHGTVFLVRGGDLIPGYGDEPLAVTNAHVVPQRVRASRVVARFEEGPQGARVFELKGKPLFSSRVDELDITVLALEKPPADMPVLRVIEDRLLPNQLDELGEDERTCSIIGHPLGEDLAISVGTSKLIDLGYKSKDRLDEIFLRYTTPTETGNSGSPVFDNNWNLIGLHRAGPNEAGRAQGIPRLNELQDTHVANEGVSFRSILDRVRAGTTKVSLSVPLEMRAVAAPTQTLAAEIAVDIDKGVDRSILIDKVVAALANPAVSQTEIDTLFDVAEADEDLMNVPEPAAPPNGGRPDTMSPEAPSSVSDLLYYAGAVALSKGFRHRRNAKFSQIASDWPGLRLVSDGDSWFQFPRPRIKDTIDHLSDKGSYAIYCGAIAGVELDRIFAQPRDTLNAIKEYDADALLLSGGGNDLLGYGRIVNFVRSFEPQLSPEQHLIEDLDDKITSLIRLYRRLISSALQTKPNLKVFCHGYDYAKPKQKGAWIGGPLYDERGMGDPGFQAEIVKAIVKRFNEAMIAMAAQFPDTVHFVDCRGLVKKADEWLDELHPRSAGFGLVADKFDAKIREVFKQNARLRVRAS